MYIPQNNCFNLPVRLEAHGQVNIYIFKYQIL